MVARCRGAMPKGVGQSNMCTESEAALKTLLLTSRMTSSWHSKHARPLQHSIGDTAMSILVTGQPPQTVEQYVASRPEVFA
jgi:hypothetical protein